MGELGSAIYPRLDAVGRAHGFSLAATLCLHRALAAGGGMAQFSHPELGGLGQWAGGGMIMIGEMGNAALRQRVGALCAALAALPASETGRVDPGAAGPAARPAEFSALAPDAGPWWPAGLGRPSSSGAQGEMAYAWFPQARRLAVRHGDRLAVYDTGEHGITGLSQGGGAASLRLRAGAHEIGLSELVEVGEAARDWTKPRMTEARDEPAPRAGEGLARSRGLDAPADDMTGPGDPLATIGRLAALQAAGALTEQEFVAKKTELLARV